MSGVCPPSPLQPAAFGVFEAMQRSRAQALRTRAVGRDGAWLVHWRNADTQTHYQRPGHHTLSLYLQGGEQVRNRDDLSARGGPGSLCSLPAGHASHWDVQGELQLLHLYLPELPLAAAAERWFDMDPRLAGLRERIYFEDPVLAAWGARLAALDWAHPDSALALEHGLLQLQARLLLAHGTQNLAPPRLRGGLSPQARRRVLDCMETEGPSPSLAELAEAACLSEYHFLRMFKSSFGQSPHAWLMRRRLDRARELLAQGRLSLAEVAQRCGYAHLSHLNAALRGAGLGSARRYREATQDLVTA